jgi:hypothetical protein
VMVHGDIHSLDGTIYARGECLCIKLKPEQIDAGRKG